MMMGPGYGLFGMGGGLLMMLLWLLIIGLVVYMAAKSANTRAGGHAAAGPAAIDIAKSRLASGEITVEEFEQIKKTLL
ncbi:MAG: SHOCT domain-containing protein [Ectobacillus sp.]